MDTPPLPPGATATVGAGGLDLVTVHTSRCTGALYLQGAHVSGWAPTGQRRVLWMSEHSAFHPGKAIRGGIPICAPWFGSGRHGDRSPAHGFFRLAPWRLVGAQDTHASVQLTLELTPADCRGLPGADTYPPFHARYSVSMGDSLDLALTITALDSPLVVEEALHTYFSIAGIDEVHISGLDGATFIDKAPGGRPENLQRGDVVFSAETDRVYRSPEAVRLVDPEMQRIITVSKQGSADTVVWNPWMDKAAAMLDFGDHEWPAMVCVESANVLDASVELAAGQSHTMNVSISVS